MNLDRRQLMTYAIGLVGGSVAVTAFGGLTAGEDAGTPGTYFTAPRRALLNEVIDLMIPETETPGALSLGVPGYIDQMMARWASPETKKVFDEVLDGVDAQARSAQGRGLLALEAGQRLDVLTRYDAANLTDDPRSMMGGYARFKELVMTAYFLSEVGATQVLRLEEVPGPFRGDIPVSEVGRTWAY